MCSQALKHLTLFVCIHDFPPQAQAQTTTLHQFKDWHDSNNTGLTI
jgi:hypothetical protein